MAEHEHEHEHEDPEYEALAADIEDLLDRAEASDMADQDLLSEFLDIFDDAVNGKYQEEP